MRHSNRTKPLLSDQQPRGEEIINETVEEEAAPPINEIFEERLCRFYSNAVKNIILDQDYQLFHSLISIKKAQIVRGDLLVYSEVDRVEHEFLERKSFGVGFNWIGKLSPQKSSSHTNTTPPTAEEKERLSNLITNLKSSSSAENPPDCLLVRVWVDVNCSGIFLPPSPLISPLILPLLCSLPLLFV